MGKTTVTMNPAEFLHNHNEAESQPSVSAQANSAASKPIYRTYGGEARSKRTLVALTPTMFEEAKARACTMGVSFNEYITRLIEADLHGK